jgi:phage gp46-like protein
MVTISPLTRAGIAVLPPDILWSQTIGDIALGGRGGLASDDSIRTAVILCLFTDARASDDEMRPEFAGDARGWIGDGFDVDAGRFETALGSKLWLYRRHELTDETARLVAAEAKRALQPLVRQGVAVRVATVAEAQKAEGRIALSVQVVGSDGAVLADERFDILWSLARGL